MTLLRNFFIGLSTNETARNFVKHFGPARQLSRRFVAGESLDEAIAVSKALNANGIKVILNSVGESVSNQAEAQQSAQNYQDLLQRVKAEGIEASITIKPSQVGLAFDPDFCYEAIADIVQSARELDILVEIDIEGSPDVEATLRMYHRLLDTFEGGVRQAVQSYLHRTPADVKRLIERGGGIRLVKGAYQELPEIALQDKKAINQACLDIIEMMLTPDALDRGAYLVLGSHDPLLIEALLEKAKTQNIKAEQFEIQMLLGVRRDEQQRLADLGYQMRVYVPYGPAWYPYFMRRLAERPANVFFILRAMVGK